MKSKSDLWDELLQFVGREMERHKIPGVGIGIFHNGECYSGGLGITSIENPLPVDDNTLFQIGSITKTFTCTVIMKLVDQGKLSLDTAVSDIIPSFKLSDPETTDQCTIRHLLTHTGGWVGDFFIDTGSGGDALDEYVRRMKKLDQIAPIGSHFSYNNSGFIVLGLVIEKILEKPYEQAIREIVLAPLKMENSYFNPTEVMVKNFAVGHMIIDNVLGVAKPWPLTKCTYPAGGLVSDVKDLIKYAQFHLKGDTETEETVLDTETRLLMQEPQFVIRPEKESIGLSWGIKYINETVAIGHGGGTLGQISQFLLVPAEEFALIVLTNADLGRQLVKDVQKWCLREYLEVEIPPLETIEASPEQMKELEGRYLMPKVSYTDIAILGNTLVAQDVNIGGFPTEDTPPPPAPPPYRIGFTADDNLVILDGEYKDFEGQILRDESGEFSYLRFGGRLLTRIKSN